MKIAVLASGGVDSSVALRLLKDAGHDVTAFYLKIWLEDELDYLGQCPWEEDLEYVQRLCEDLDVPLEVVAMQQDYHARIIDYALDEVRAGRTPNPDVLCNSRVKFGAFYDRIDASFQRVATGHYAGLRRVADDSLSDDAGGTGGERVDLICTPDPVKDQTYFLAHLSQAQLQRAEFPIGAYQKSDVRRLAQELDVPAQDRKDSQGLCFLGKINFRDFLRHHLGEARGDIVEAESGRVLGPHGGAWFYTIGQRQGLGLSGGPWYVVRKDIPGNRVLVSRNYFADDAEKTRNEFWAGGLHWISGAPSAEELATPGRLRVKLRHGPASYACRTEWEDDGVARVRIEGRDQGIAPGQFAVFYRPADPERAEREGLQAGDQCLGCGTILEESAQGLQSDIAAGAQSAS